MTIPAINPLRVLQFLAVCTAWLMTAPVMAQTDAPGAADHPLIKRYDGSVILARHSNEFDAFDIATGPHTSFAATLTERQTVEGAWTRLLYVAPEGRSSLEVLRNYSNELAGLGFETIFTCAGRECGMGPDQPRAGSALIRSALLPRESMRSTSRVVQFAFSQPNDVRFLSARLDRPEGAVYVSLAVAVEAFDHFAATANRVLILLDVVETGELEERMVRVIPAAQLAAALSEAGRVALYGIYFDTGSAQIKPESADMLAEIATLMAGDPVLRLHVVGHTDNQGGFDHNMGLSNRRAEAVTRALTQDHGVAAGRLRPAGVGVLAPVATNDTEDGRALNRRVELVRQ